ncbi:hypothetical protein FGADI_2327 [Fusarium gaditjirri]|uniref:Uncharacterized protein n=1 Tax=Fusarium gaditjirri TaxID=282569 RepID=A0A8H4TIW6_9HYPO|nr:hypothetical protein FGADI_2327 [Fusarium gaditjirri]
MPETTPQQEESARPVSGPRPVSEITTLRAENERLKALMDSRQKVIKALEAKVDRLQDTSEHLKSLHSKVDDLILALRETNPAVDLLARSSSDVASNAPTFPTTEPTQSQGKTCPEEVSSIPEGNKETGASRKRYTIPGMPRDSIRSVRKLSMPVRRFGSRVGTASMRRDQRTLQAKKSERLSEVSKDMK